MIDVSGQVTLSEEVTLEKKRKSESEPCGSGEETSQKVQTSVVVICLAEKWMGDQYGWSRKKQGDSRRGEIGENQVTNDRAQIDMQLSVTQLFCWWHKCGALGMQRKAVEVNSGWE